MNEFYYGTWKDWKHDDFDVVIDIRHTAFLSFDKSEIKSIEKTVKEILKYHPELSPDQVFYKEDAPYDPNDEEDMIQYLISRFEIQTKVISEDQLHEISNNLNQILR